MTICMYTVAGGANQLATKGIHCKIYNGCLNLSQQKLCNSMNMALSLLSALGTSVGMASALHIQCVIKSSMLHKMASTKIKRVSALGYMPDCVDPAPTSS
jgi:hypothetical protein